MSLEHKVDVRSELNSFAGRHCQEPVVIQNGIQGFYPFRIDVSIAYNPGLNILRKEEVARSGGFERRLKSDNDQTVVSLHLTVTA